MVRINREHFGPQLKIWGSICDDCEHRLRKETTGCLESGCSRFRTTIDKHRNNKIYYATDCTSCLEWKPVHPSNGLACTRCGKGCVYAYEAYVASEPLRTSLSFGGPLVDDSPEEDEELDEDFVEGGIKD